jgi:hypothetical protein
VAENLGQRVTPNRDVLFAPAELRVFVPSWLNPFGKKSACTIHVLYKRTQIGYTADFTLALCQLAHVPFNSSRQQFPFVRVAAPFGDVNSPKLIEFCAKRIMFEM